MGSVVKSHRFRGSYLEAQSDMSVYDNKMTFIKMQDGQTSLYFHNHELALGP